jgi:hypothetical protein
MQIIPARTLTGGTSGCVDALYTGGEVGYYATFTEGDFVFAALSTGIHHYVWNSTSALDENSPLVIKPDFSSSGVAYTGNGRWELVGLVDRAFFEMGFTYATSSPMTIVTIAAGMEVYKATIFITTAFNGTSPTISIGDVGNTARLMTTTENNPKSIATYEVNPTYIYSSKTAITMTIVPSASSAGVGRVLLHLQGKV